MKKFLKFVLTVFQIILLVKTIGKLLERLTSEE